MTRKKKEAKPKAGTVILESLTPFVDDFNVHADGSISLKIGSYETTPSPERLERLKEAFKRANK